MNEKELIVDVLETMGGTLKGFCPTGEGGGQDNSCSGSGGGGGGRKPSGSSARIDTGPQGGSISNVFSDTGGHGVSKYSEQEATIPGASMSAKQRKLSLQTAKKAGFKPTSSNSWINEQQAIEFIQNTKEKNTIDIAKKKGFKPTSSDHFINHMQAKQHLRKETNRTPSPKVVKKVGKSKAKNPREVALEITEFGPPASWSDFSKAQQMLLDKFKKDFPKESGPKIKKSVTKVLKSHFNAESLVGRVMSTLMGETYPKDR